MADNVFNALPLDLTLDISYTPWQPPEPSRDPDLDEIFNCLGYDRNGNRDQGVIQFTLNISGQSLNTYFSSSPIDFYLQLWARTMEGTVIPATSTSIDFTLQIDGEAFKIPLKASWVQWSDIGHVDFTITDSNVAGERPLPWNGYVYQIRKLGSGVVVYSQSGVAVMNPSENVWGLKTLMSIGLKSKNSVTGTDDTHYFIDKQGALWKLTQGGLELKDFRNHLSVLTSKTVMSYDERRRAVYITDNVYGFVFTESGGLGQCPENITGMGYKAGSFYVTAPGPINTLPLNICTDIIDFGSRDEKTIEGIDIGTDVTEDIYVAIDYRWNKSQGFFSTPWVKADRHGRAFLMASGIEFRIRIRAEKYVYLRLDYVQVKGKTSGQIAGNA